MREKITFQEIMDKGIEIRHRKASLNEDSYIVEMIKGDHKILRIYSKYDFHYLRYIMNSMVEDLLFESMGDNTNE